MSRASSHALKHPPVTAPSEPAGALPSFPELAVAIERERRRGRGAQSNDSGRFEAEARVAFDDGWQSLDELPPFKTIVALDTARKVITRNDSPDIGFDRSINPYRGCEHGCVYCFARPTHAYLGLSPGLDFEFAAVCQARRAGAAGKGTGGPGLRAAHDRDRHQHRPLPADRARAADHARHSRGARSRRPSGRHRHQVGAGHPRHRHSGADGQAQSRQGGALGHDARCEAGAHHGAPGLDPAEAARGAAAAVRSGDSDHGDGGAGDTRAERFRDRAYSRRRGACRRQGSQLCAAAASARSARSVPRMADRRTIPTATGTSSR